MTKLRAAALVACVLFSGCTSVNLQPTVTGMHDAVAALPGVAAVECHSSYAEFTPQIYCVATAPDAKNVELFAMQDACQKAMIALANADVRPGDLFCSATNGTITVDYNTPKVHDTP